MESAEAEVGMSVVDLFIRLELAKTKSEVRRLIKGGGAKLNDQKITDESFVVDMSTFDGKDELKLSSGKKKHGIIFLE
ncbi:MAG: S4 domain-containing protein [Pseudomonadota bacterium]